ncbi:MAG: hypothetical protein Edafosvirus1_37 [Edafosvirus sp.]|uniref:Uncharacterized protein n=1 Tax=Edafosvirus sp. TaxID=2487765 RepID=A0A3G4ZS19_9VIRU|nr:MAG: hypothetical protein Edafosvirus1_37 [Edafosvirus sp.]
MTDLKTMIPNLRKFYADKEIISTTIEGIEEQEFKLADEKIKCQKQLEDGKNLVIDAFNKKFNELEVGDYIYVKIESTETAEFLIVWTKIKIIIMDKERKYIVLDNNTIKTYEKLNIDKNFPITQFFVPVVGDDELTQNMIKSITPEGYTIHFLESSDYCHVQSSA